MRKTKNNYVPAEYGGYLFPKSCLPDILPGDGGKVLTVNQNETEAIWAQSGGGIFWVTARTVTELETDVLMLDKTFLEIFTAMRNNLLCVITYEQENDPPTSYDAMHDVITRVYYDPVGGAGVDAYNITFTCSSVNDYPVVID